MPQTSSMLSVLSPLALRRMDSRAFSRAGRRPTLLACILEGHPFPGEPTDISGKERAALWLHDAYLDGSLHREQKCLRGRLKRMNKTSMASFIMSYMVPFAYLVLAMDFINPLWFVMVVTVSFLCALAVANWFHGKMDSVGMSLDAISPSLWTVDLMEHACEHVRHCGDVGPVAEMEHAARRREWPGIRCLESLSVSDRVSLMRLTERFRHLENTKSMPALDGDTKELIGRTISVLEEDA